MDPSPAVPESLRFVRTLGPRSVLACTPGRRSQRWVLKAIGASEAPSTLRTDFQDLAMLRHPGLAAPCRIERTRAEQAYVSRPWVEGKNLADTITRKKPSAHGPWLLAAAEALAILHGAGFLHRNLRASNVLVPRGSERKRRVVLCDPAWWPDASSGPDSPPSPRAPEQRKEPICTPRAELFALGHIFYSLIAGASPTNASDELAPSLSDVDSDVPSDLNRVLLKLLHPDPNRRPRSASELVDDLKRFVTDERSTRAPLELFVGRTEETDEGVRRLESSRPTVTS